jgi:hypothetical protein
MISRPRLRPPVIVFLTEEDLADRPAEHPWHDTERLFDRRLELPRLARLCVTKDAGEGAERRLVERSEAVWSRTAELRVKGARDTQGVLSRLEGWGMQVSTVSPYRQINPWRAWESQVARRKVPANHERSVAIGPNEAHL